MNKYTIKIVALALSIGSLGSIQATPFRKLATYIGAAGYWGTIAALPAYNYIVGYQNMKNILENEALPISSEARENILEMAHECGFNDLDNVTFKHHPYFSFAAAAPDNTIIINPLAIHDAIQYDGLNTDALIGTLLHEKRHIDREHTTYLPTITASLPFGLHCVKKALSPAKPSIVPPSITRSLLRIPQAAALYFLAKPIKLGIFKCLERDADAALKDKPAQARAVATFFRNIDKNQVQYIQEDAEELAEKIGLPQAKSTIGNLLQFKHDHFSPHPPLLTRANYLERWADEAERNQK